MPAIPCNAKIYVASHESPLGKSLVKKLRKEGFFNIVTKDKEELNLTNQKAVDLFFRCEKPEYVFLFSEKDLGIQSRKNFCADLLKDNLSIQTNIIHASFVSGVKKLIYTASIYEEPSISFDPYEIITQSGISLCKAYNNQYGTRFQTCILANPYGLYDHFDPSSSHVIPSLISKICTAKRNHLPTVEIWGDGEPLRDFIYIDDATTALYSLFESPFQNEVTHIATGNLVSIKDLATSIKQIIGYEGFLVFNPSICNGKKQIPLSTDEINSMGWVPSFSLSKGLERTIRWYLHNQYHD